MKSAATRDGGAYEQQIFLPEYLQHSVNTPRTRQPPAFLFFLSKRASRFPVPRLLVSRYHLSAGA